MLFSRSSLDIHPHGVSQGKTDILSNCMEYEQQICELLEQLVRIRKLSEALPSISDSLQILIFATHLGFTVNHGLLYYKARKLI